MRKPRIEASTLVWLFLVCAIAIELANAWRIDRYIRRAEAAALEARIASEAYRSAERERWAKVEALSEAAGPTMALMDARLRWWDRAVDRGKIVAVERETFNQLLEAIEDAKGTETGTLPER